MTSNRIRLVLGALALSTALATAGCTKEPAAEAEPAAAAEPAAEAAAEAEAEAATGTEAAAPAAAAVAASEPAAEGGDVYGTGVGDDSETVSIADLSANPEAYAGKSVRVEGTVTDVCPKRGCWFDMAGSEPGQKMRFKVRDGEMVFPVDAKGKYAVAEGVVALQPLSLEQTREYLAYQAREYGADVDPESVTEPMTIVRLDGKGAVIRDAE